MHKYFIMMCDQFRQQACTHSKRSRFGQIDRSINQVLETQNIFSELYSSASSGWVINQAGL